ncbi:hypothetical protein ASPZODRAFT_15636 [Penicilliopsis zonata CBS 506.65]|uniref:Uncharacterized protein n=1 Tax=Penicilliopsis zonata CBS 506.65 TaxID=1073090 RepID=A0A1L9SIH3_9EURO|nr:hypothetical protein ASPZODRAFT_15636 [Penicilliopsis zonata CBS 506.65]OJJ46947.1 hypothetical protein ASPZODRAFT_15636 [Penicilliopsis zonata CBS 506.65]
MSLKRKASFPALMSPEPMAIDSYDSTVDGTPKHLHSRTRKRFRDDRPSDETIYEKTLRWLFSAQKQQQQQQQTTVDEDMDLEPLPSPEPVDPRQQTLLKFFRPSRPTSHHSILAPDSSATCSNTTSGSNSPISQDTDMDRNARTDGGSGGSKAWAGGLQWT